MATDKESNNTSSATDTIEPGDLGKLLKEYRETAQLNIDQISDALCLTNTSIRALESESFDALPEAPYVRGYLRNYAGLANRDPKPLVDTYNVLTGGSPTDESILANTTNAHQELAKPLITPQRFRLALLAALLLLLGLLTMIPGVRDWTSNIWSGFSTEHDTTIASDGVSAEPSLNLPSLTGDVPGNLPIAPKAPEPAADEEEPSTEEGDPSADVEPAADQKSASEDQPENQEKADGENQSTETTSETTDNGDEHTIKNENASVEGNTQLKLVFTDEVWIRIRDENGKTVFEALHPAHTEKELSLNTPLKLKVGNAPGMVLFVNGKEMDISQFTQGSVANFGIE